jgi:hypothetical protein
LVAKVIEDKDKTLSTELSKFTEELKPVEAEKAEIEQATSGKKEEEFLLSRKPNWKNWIKRQAKSSPNAKKY